MGSVFHALGWTLLILGYLLASWKSLDYYPRMAAKHPLGVICFLVPIVQLVYIAAHWKESKEAFLLQIAGLVLVILGALAGVPGS